MVKVNSFIYIVADVIQCHIPSRWGLMPLNKAFVVTLMHILCEKCAVFSAIPVTHLLHHF